MSDTLRSRHTSIPSKNVVTMWYAIRHSESVITPSVAVYRDRVRENISRMLAIVGSPERLCPHVKTHKMANVTRLYLQAGVKQFKCATIAEAEMLADCGVDYILLAYQPVGPQVQRLVRLAKSFPKIVFATIVDVMAVAEQLSSAATDAGLHIDLLLDVDVGMHRTGIQVGPEAEAIYEWIGDCRGLRQGGLHVYDGQIRDREISLRTRHVEQAFEPVHDFRERLLARGSRVPRTIAGGTPSFSIHARHPDRICSPGTCIFWDTGYEQLFPDLDFLHAAVLLTRVISKPTPGQVCVDLGYKAVAAENPPPRVRFLNLEGVQEVGYSEEHLILETAQSNELSVGDLLYAIPRHICPTVALHQQAQVIEDGNIVDTWKVTARDRILSV